VHSATTAPILAPLPQLRFADLLCLEFAFLVEDQDTDGIPARDPESFREAAAVSADASSLKMAKTTVLFDMSISSPVGQAR